MICAVHTRAAERSRGARGSLSTSPARPTLSFDPPAHAEGAARSGGAKYFTSKSDLDSTRSAERPTAVLELWRTDLSAVNGWRGRARPITKLSRCEGARAQRTER